MRLWSLHPRYLDAQGLVALWREGLLAQKVLTGRTHGYRHHPQLTRFRAGSNPRAALAAYLVAVWAEANQRGYAFDARKIGRHRATKPMPVSAGQLRFELAHLRRKLWRRDRARHRALRGIALPEPHPLFRRRRGPVESWERP